MENIHGLSLKCDDDFFSDDKLMNNKMHAAKGAGSRFISPSVDVNKAIKRSRDLTCILNIRYLFMFVFAALEYERQ